MSEFEVDFNCSSDAASQDKRSKKGYSQGRSIIHTNVAEALKLRQVQLVLILCTSELREPVLIRFKYVYSYVLLGYHVSKIS